MKKNYVYEEWRDIKGFEGIYQISNFGRVKSLPKITNNQYSGKETILKISKTQGGYCIVNLYKNGKGTIKLVHRLVAESFIQNPNNFRCVNHKGENKTKNYVWQLEWCNHLYNNNYGTRNERLSKTKLENRDKSSFPILQFDKLGNFIKEWVNAYDCERELGYNQGNICLCCLGKRKSANGYVWKYKKDV